MRMSVDDCALNNISIKNYYPLLHIDEFLDLLQVATIFSKVELCSGYHQIELPSWTPQDRFPRPQRPLRVLDPLFHYTS